MGFGLELGPQSTAANMVTTKRLSTNRVAVRDVERHSAVSFGSGSVDERGMHCNTRLMNRVRARGRP